MRFSRQDIKNFDSPIGDPFNGPSVNKHFGQKYQDPITATVVVGAALAGISAYGSIKSGQDRNTMYQMQAKQAEVEGDRRSAQYEIQANEVLRRVNSANAAAVARGFAGGVYGFEGSAALIQDINSTRGGKEFAFALSNGDMAQRNGLIQATLYEGAGSIAQQAGYFDAAGKLGMAAMATGKIGGPPSGGGGSSGGGGGGGFQDVSVRTV